MAGSVCLQTAWHLRQALNDSVIHGMSGVGWGFLLPVVLGTDGSNSSSSAGGLAVRSDTVTPERSCAFVLQSIGYLSVTRIARACCCDWKCYD